MYKDFISYEEAAQRAFDQVKGKLGSEEMKVKLSGDSSSYTFQFTKPSTMYSGRTYDYPQASCYVTRLYGCCAAMIFMGLSANNEPLMERMIEAVEIFSRLTGHTQLLYTTNGKQPSMVNALKARGFKPVSEYRSYRTEADITMWEKNVMDGVQEGYSRVGEAPIPYKPAPKAILVPVTPPLEPAGQPVAVANNGGPAVNGYYIR